MTSVRRRSIAHSTARQEAQSLLRQNVTQHERMIAHDCLRTLSTENFEAEKAAHVHLLQDLWREAGIRDEFAIKSEEWTHLGFQRTDPRSDFRGGGVLSLEHMIAFVRQHGVAELDSSNPLQAFPLSIASINVTSMLTAYFHLRDVKLSFLRAETRSECSPSTLQAFLALGWQGEPGEEEKEEDNEEEEEEEEATLRRAVSRLQHVLQLLHATLLNHLHRSWRRMVLEDARTTLMDFPCALRATRAALVRATRAQGTTAWRLESLVREIEHPTPVEVSSGPCHLFSSSRACECAVVMPSAFSAIFALAYVVGGLLGICASPASMRSDADEHDDEVSETAAISNKSA